MDENLFTNAEEMFSYHNSISLNNIIQQDQPAQDRNNSMQKLSRNGRESSLIDKLYTISVTDKGTEICFDTAGCPKHIIMYLNWRRLAKLPRKW